MVKLNERQKRDDTLKGLNFEKNISELFRRKGYSVTPNVRIKGVSGVKHQIDVFAKLKQPLLTSKVIIECKYYKQKINKEIVMKLIQIVDDISVDKGILITTSEFTPDAIKTAEGTRVELWNRTKLVDLLGELQLAGMGGKTLGSELKKTLKAIKPEISIQMVEEYAQNRTKKLANGGFLGFGATREQISEIQSLYYPFYELKFQKNIASFEKRGWFSQEKVKKRIKSTISIDGLTGEIISLDKNKNITKPFANIQGLSPDCFKIMRTFGNNTEFTVKDVVKLGYNFEQAKKLMRTLEANDIVSSDIEGGARRVSRPRSRSNVGKLIQAVIASDERSERVKWYMFSEIPDFNSLGSLTEMYEMSRINTKSGFKFLSFEQDSTNVQNGLEKYFEDLSILEISASYYPFFVLTFAKEDGSERFEILDGMTGKNIDISLFDELFSQI